MRLSSKWLNRVTPAQKKGLCNLFSQIWHILFLLIWVTHAACARTLCLTFSSLMHGICSFCTNSEDHMTLGNTCQNVRQCACYMYVFHISFWLFQRFSHYCLLWRACHRTDCQFQLLWPIQGDPGFRKKNDEDNCLIYEENVYQQIGYRKNRRPLLMWFRARLDTSHKMDSFALQKYMGWIARRSNGKSARHYFQPCFTYSLLFVKRPLRRSMARCHACWNHYGGDWKSYLQLHEASGDKVSPAVHIGKEDGVNPKGWQMRQHWQGFMECWKTPHQTVSTRTKSSCRMKRWKIAGYSQRWEMQKFCKKDSLPEENK